VKTSIGRLRLGLVAGAATFVVFAAGGAAARAIEPVSPDATNVQDLKAQVQQLTALVQALSKQDQQQIEALSDQVRALQTKLKQQEAASSDNGTPMPRATQNANAGFSVKETTDTPDPSVALPRVTQNATHRFALQSADGQYSIGLTGDIQFDTGAYLDFRARSRVVGPQELSNGVNARRARTAFGNWGFALVYDAGNSSDQTAKGIETAQIIYSGLHGAAFEIGYSNTFFTLDQSTGSNDTLFIERASPSNIATNFNTGDARANVGARFFGDRYWIGGYLTGPGSGDSHTLTGERFGAFQRAAFQVVNGPNYSLHLGFGVDELLRAPNTGNGTANVLSLSDQPELRIDPTTLLNTGSLGSLANPVTGGYVLDIETAATYGPLFWQGEYYRYEVDRRGLANAKFDGGYGQASWTLTGESHLYNPQAGAYFRIAPKHPFSMARGDWGAWELAARASYVNLDSNYISGTALSANPAAVGGGLQRSYSLGLNWYPNDLVRFLLDFSYVNYDKANGVLVKGAALGAPVGATFNALSLRAQVAY
jgi:phosphate-selective porin OprO/OprP